MTLKELYLSGKHSLEEAGIDNPAFDAAAVLNHCLGYSRHDTIINGDIPISCEQETEYLNTIGSRASGEPLQYITGVQYFMDIPFLVGEGVLIPRDDTEIVVSLGIDYLKNEANPTVVDLC